MPDVDMILSERARTYGTFLSNAATAQQLKTCLHSQVNWHVLPVDCKEAIEMIMHKISRIINGDPEYLDSWHDIAGYAMCVANRIEQESGAGFDDREA